jgi:hypothetical protein
MTFEKGSTYKTRGGEATALVRDVRPRSLFVDYSDGPMWTADLGGFVNGPDAPHDRDLLPGAIEDEPDLARDLYDVRVPTPDTDTKWDRDARAALTGLLANPSFCEALADHAERAAQAADALAAERARRGEVK